MYTFAYRLGNQYKPIRSKLCTLHIPQRSLRKESSQFSYIAPLFTEIKETDINVCLKLLIFILINYTRRS